jgi:DNA transposition AAA+ family ATPase
MGDTTSEEFDPLRARVRELAAQRGMTFADVSRLSGVAYATCYAFMNGKYSGQNARVAEKLDTWLTSIQEQTQARANAGALPSYVHTPTAAAFTGVLLHAQSVPDLVVITGGAGVGKTTAAREYQLRHPNVWLMTCEPACGSTHAMLEHLCETMGLSENATNRRSRAIIRRVTNASGLIIVDEAQHLATQALDQLRTLHDKAGVGLALLGNEQVYSRLEGGGRRAEFAQLFSRVGMRIARARPLASDVDALLDAAGVEGKAERKLMRAVAAKPGALRGMSKTLRVAMMIASVENSETLTEQHLSDAWNRLSDHAQIGEPA